MRKIAIAAFTTVIAAAACGGGSSAQTAASPAPSAAAPTAGAVTQAPSATQPAATAPAASAPASATRKLALNATNSLYSITTLDVKPGERIEFVLTNSGDEKHNLVGIGEGISIVSPDFDAGQTVSWIWTAPTKLGTFKLICAYHKEIPPITVTVK